MYKKSARRNTEWAFLLDRRFPYQVKNAQLGRTAAKMKLRMDNNMKKGEIYQAKIEKVDFPNKGTAEVDGEKVIVKNAVPGQTVSFLINKKRKGKCEGRLLEVLEKAPDELPEAACRHFGECGGCNYQTLPYEKQLELKSAQVKTLLNTVVPGFDDVFEGIKGSPCQFGYRNKMEFTFGDAYKDGPLALGMHKRGSFYDIVTVTDCQNMDEDYRQILACTAQYFRDNGIPYYHRMRHDGYLRHLLVRKAVKTGEILISLITSTQLSCLLAPNLDGENQPETEKLDPKGLAAIEEELLKDYKQALLNLPLEGGIAGILHTKNDSLADAVKNEGTDILYGKDFFYEELLGLRFRITPFSFFQTNSLGAEVLYETSREFIRGVIDVADKTLFDLYSGTGTIAQILSPTAKKVIGVEIVEEAVEAAKENASWNGLTNCEFIAGDVLKAIDDIPEHPDFIILDPPRDGVHAKALEKIMNYNAEYMLYISCKPTSLQRDLEILQAGGYRVARACCVDLFPGTVHVETVCCLQRVNS